MSIFSRFFKARDKPADGLNAQNALNGSRYSFFFGGTTAGKSVNEHIGWFLGGMDGLLYALIAFAVIDYLTGVMCAIADKELSSNVGFKGIFRKVLIFVMVGVGHIIDSQVLGNGSALRTAIIFFYLSNEGLSLLENAGHLGLPIPEKLKDVLAQLHNREDKEDGK